MPFVFRVFLAAILACLASLPASAHFSEGTKLRTILIASNGDRLTAYLRTPAPLLFADTIETARAEDRPLESPFLKGEFLGTGYSYVIPTKAVVDRKEALAERIAGSLAWTQDGKPVDVTVETVRLRTREPDSAFDTQKAAANAIALESTGLDPNFGEAYFEITLTLHAPDNAGALQVRSTLPAIEVAANVTIDNHIIDARGETPIAYTMEGQLESAATIDGSLVGTLARFTWQGVLHIIEGIDHVFLVVCLALGVATLRRLIWIVTAFTLGHSVTLITTFLGATPAWPWFIPAVETAIAATVLYAAVVAFWRKMDSIAVIAGIGLLHGLGFSFVLGEILGRDAPNLIPALAAFNIGIEIGQLAIIAVVLAVVAVATRLSKVGTPILRNAALAAIAAMAFVWVVERGASLIA
ncbi:HupE/UreJ family protein [Oricola sp.]|uniref:HupE/UreJ family protein n=1 Tax=Oricola sp. TaxID=1979950 RepID=UPI003BAB9B36